MTIYDYGKWTKVVQNYDSPEQDYWLRGHRFIHRKRCFLFNNGKLMDVTLATN